MKQHSEIILIGGGLIGLSLAVELKCKGATVTVLSRTSTESAGLVGAGMLAPQAEQLPPGPMLELCLRSRALYNDWTRQLEEITGLDTGYWPSPLYQFRNHSRHPQLLVRARSNFTATTRLRG